MRQPESSRLQPSSRWLAGKTNPVKLAKKLQDAAPPEKKGIGGKAHYVYNFVILHKMIKIMS